MTGWAGLVGWFDRLASHSYASPRPSTQAQTGASAPRNLCNAHGSCRRPVVVQPQSFLGPRASRPLQATRRHMFSQGQTYQRVQCHPGILQEADYSFYEGLAESAITDDWLWETRLEGVLGYLPQDERDKVREALVLAYTTHQGQRRRSGEPFITHPVEVCRILAEFRMDWESLAAGLLHDTVEDQPNVITFEEIQIAMNASVRAIVEGETKFSKNLDKLDEIEAGTADPDDLDLKQLFLAMIEDVRIIIVKLADRLHNMRTLDSMPPHKQKKIATETLEVFAPLARRLGLYLIKEELEELSFRYAHPELYAGIKRRLDELAAQQGPSVIQAREALALRLQKEPEIIARQAVVEFRTVQKSAYSVYRKLAQDNDGCVDERALENLQNVAQLIVVIKPDSEPPHYFYRGGQGLPYTVLAQVHNYWKPVPQMFKDYISMPKQNGYQSLHTTVLPIGASRLLRLEVQIRTAEMDRLAQFGIAAEMWEPAARSLKQREYAEGGRPSLSDINAEDTSEVSPALGYHSSKPLPPSSLPYVHGVKGANGNRVPGTHETDGTRARLNGCDVAKAGQYGAVKLGSERLDRRVNWMLSIREWQMSLLKALPAATCVKVFKEDLLTSSVCVFTRSGDVMRLPKGSTVIDFAYLVHTVLGNQMVGAKVNNELVNVGHVLKNADFVEILTYDGPPTVLSVSRHKDWLLYAKCKSVQNKLNKYVKDFGHLLPPHKRRELHLPRSDSQEVDEEALDYQIQRMPGLRTRGWGLPPLDERVFDSDVGDLKPQVTVLRVECGNVVGVLAKVSAVLSEYGHNIKAFDGREASGSRFHMSFRLEGDVRRLEPMCSAIQRLPGVITHAVFCNLEEKDSSLGPAVLSD